VQGIPYSTSSLDGEGTVDDPYLITNVTELQMMKDELDAFYKLANNIDASVTSTWNGGTGFLPIGTSATPFSGNLDGDGHTISDLTINRPTTDYIGLFGYTNGGEIKKVGLESVDIHGRNYTGALVGRNGSKISQSFATGTLETGNAQAVGGFLGYSVSTQVIENNYSLVFVTTGNTSYQVGGFIGMLASGGSANIRYNYYGGYLSTLSTTNIGGFIGQTSVTLPQNINYYDEDTAGVTTSAGGSSIVALSYDQSQMMASYAGFDFTALWRIAPTINTGYPYLSIFHTALPSSSIELNVDYITASSVGLSWDLDLEATKYTIERDGVVIYEGVDLLFSDTDVEAGQIYSYRLYASNEHGVGPASIETVTIPGGTALSLSVPGSFAFPTITLNGRVQTFYTPLGDTVDIEGASWRLNVSGDTLREVGGIGLALPSGSLIMDGTWIVDDGSSVHIRSGSGDTSIDFGSQALAMTILPSIVTVDAANYPSGATPYQTTLHWSVVAGP
jgi:hypothetical protein